MAADSSAVPPELARELRALLRNAGVRGLAASTLVERFGADDGRRLLEALITRGAIEATAEEGHHRITPAGRFYATGRGAALFTRKAADKALEGFLRRCHDLARAPGSLCVPTRVVLLGDMLGESPQVSGVDLALTLRFTPVAEERLRTFDPSQRKPLMLGLRAYGDVDGWQTAATTAACLYLRARSPILDVSRRIASLAVDVPHRLVFDAREARPSLVPPRR